MLYVFADGTAHDVTDRIAGRADRRCHAAHGHDRHHDDAEMHRVDAHLRQHRQDQGREQQDIDIGIDHHAGEGQEDDG